MVQAMKQNMKLWSKESFLFTCQTQTMLHSALFNTSPFSIEIISIFYLVSVLIIILIIDIFL